MCRAPLSTADVVFICFNIQHVQRFTNMKQLILMTITEAENSGYARELQVGNRKGLNIL